MRLDFQPRAGRRYLARLEAEDVHGHRVARTVTVVGARHGAASTALPAP